MLRYSQPIVLAIFTFITVAASAAADPKPYPPPSAKSAEELRKELKANAPKLLSPDPLPVETAEFERTGRHVLLAWFCPTSGEATCRVFSYEFNKEKKEWLLLREQLFRGTQDISPEFSNDLRLRFRDVRNKVIFEEPAAK
jgi:hypothetical protein